MSTTRILELANSVQANTAKVNAYRQEHRLPPPSFEQDGPVDMRLEAPEVEGARYAAIEACMELQDLLLGPAMTIRPILNGAPLGFIYRYDIPHKVPLHGEVSFQDLAKACNLHETDVRRLIRYAIVFHHVFHEKTPGMVSHSAASRKLAEDSQSMDGLGVMFSNGTYEAFANILDSLEKYKNQESNGTGWNLANKTSLPMYEYYNEHPELGKRFAGAMATFTAGLGLGPEALISGYDWASVGNGRGGKVVDVGGSTGHTSMAIAEAFPQLSFVVQEHPDVSAKLAGEVPSKLAHRIEFMPHDFFKPQPVEADVYFFRQIFHNWPDRACVEIIKALVPVLKPGAKIVANDHFVPPPGSMSLIQDRAVRDMDLIVMSLFNSREREEHDWKQLFEMADSRFTNFKMWVPEGSSLCLVEATWSG